MTATTITAIVQILLLIGLPWLVIELVRRSRVARAIGEVVICYIAGLAAGNIPCIPVNTALSKMVTEVSIPIAIIMLVLSTDFKRWLGFAGKTIMSFLLGTIAVVISSVSVSYAFIGKIEEVWKTAGMVIGVYTGGTPNMSAIGLALGVKEEAFILLNASDVVISGIYLLFLLSIAKRVLLLFLPPFQGSPESRYEPFQPGQQLNTKIVMRSFIITLMISIALLLAGAGISYRIKGAISEPVVIFVITAGGVLLSFVPQIRSLPKKYEFGEYFLLIFCIAIGSLSNLTTLLESSSLYFEYVSIIFVCAVLLHYFLAFIFRIDADTVIITSTAGIFGPAFVGPVAAAIRNRDVIAAGLATGLVGYAIANFLGIAVAYLFEKFLL